MVVSYSGPGAVLNRLLSAIQGLPPITDRSYAVGYGWRSSSGEEMGNFFCFPSHCVPFCPAWPGPARGRRRFDIQDYGIGYVTGRARAGCQHEYEIAFNCVIPIRIWTGGSGYRRDRPEYHLVPGRDSRPGFPPPKPPGTTGSIQAPQTPAGHGQLAFRRTRPGRR